MKFHLALTHIVFEGRLKLTAAIFIFISVAPSQQVFLNVPFSLGAPPTFQIEAVITLTSVMPII
jgi:hypothetical protein